MSESTKAVFLSYASQDSEAAKRICDALRAAGVEVWFDQSELVGGDAWDSKIRGQIGSCALFVPVISQSTQARREGYFRIEWRLAAQRTYAMSDDVTFLMPVVIDDTKDAEARVPAEFKTVQWTCLPGGETPPGFAVRVKNLLDGAPELGGQTSHGLGRATGPGAAAPRQARGLEPVETAAGIGKSEVRPNNQEPKTNNRRLGRWWWALPIFGVTMALILVLKERRKESQSGTRAPEIVKSVESVKPAAPLSEARQLVEKALQLSTTGRSSAGLIAAADLAEKATRLDATDAEVWAIAALVDISCWVVAADRTEQREEMARTKVMRAKGLAPRSVMVRYAEARMLTELELFPDGGAKAEPILRELRRENTDERIGVEITGVLGLAVAKQGRASEGARLLEEAGRTQVRWMSAASWSYLQAGMLPEALRAARQETAQERTAGLIMQMVVQWISEDLDAVRELVRQIPEAERFDEGPASAMVAVAYYQRDPDQMLAVAKLLPGDYLQNAFLDAPKAASLALAYSLAGRNEAAQLHWKTALAVVDERIAHRASDRDFLATRLWVLAKLGRQDEAEQAYRLVRELRGPQAYFEDAFDLAALGRKEEALVALTEALRRKSNLFGHLNARYDPIFDPLRGDPRFEQLIRETLLPGAKPFDEALGKPSVEPKP